MRSLFIGHAEYIDKAVRSFAMVRADEKRCAERSEVPELFSGSRAPSYTVISESGLYKLIMRSDKPEARTYQDWVTREVLPAIRKTGGYLQNEEACDTATATTGSPCLCLSCSHRSCRSWPLLAWPDEALD